jgi:DinB superfamily
MPNYGRSRLNAPAVRRRSALSERLQRYIPVMTDASSPAELAELVAAARDRLLAFAASCTDEVWLSTPLAGHGDHRPAGVIVDHVANAYEYMAGWMREILAGATPAVDVALVDRLNAAHAGTASHLTQAGAMEHLTRSGDDIIALIAGLAETDLEAGGGRVRRFAEIAARHPDTHRADIEEAMRGSAV